MIGSFLSKQEQRTTPWQIEDQPLSFRGLYFSRLISSASFINSSPHLFLNVGLSFHSSENFESIVWKWYGRVLFLSVVSDFQRQFIIIFVCENGLKIIYWPSNLIFQISGCVESNNNHNWIQCWIRIFKNRIKIELEQIKLGLVFLILKKKIWKFLKSCHFIRKTNEKWLKLFLVLTKNSSNFITKITFFTSLYICFIRKSQDWVEYVQFLHTNKGML